MSIGPAEWCSLGSITIDSENKPQFPRDLLTFATKIPGNYRLTFNNGYLYIGKTKDLRRRLGDYRTPTLGTEQEHVLHYILIAAGGAEVAVIPESNLPSGKTRHVFETDEQNAAINAGKPLLNKRGYGRGYYLEFKVKYHEKMLSEARRALEEWSASQQR